jgi:CheY-like chemotaxis protein
MGKPDDGPVRILLLEDSDIDADLIEQHLARELNAFSVTRAADREAFVKALDEGGIDLILSSFPVSSARSSPPRR